MSDNDSTSTKTETELLIAITRLEGKVDVALAQQATHAREIKDHELRLRRLELTPTVTPRTLWTVFASAVGIVLAAIPVLQKLFS